MRPKIGIVGLNHGYVLAQKARLLESVELVSLCAHNPEKHRAKAVELQVPLHATVNAMLDAARLDGVIIAVPTDQLVKIAEQCLERGVAVLVEKPLGCNLKEALQLRQTATAAGVPVMVGYHRRLSSQILELRRLLASNVIGEVRSVFCKWLVKKPPSYFKNWRVRRESGGGCLMINAIHEIDTLQYLFGPIVLVGALGQLLPVPFSSNVEHSLSVTMKLQSGPLVTAIFSDQCPSPFSYENTVAAGTKFPLYPVDCYYFFGSAGWLAFPSFSMGDVPPGSESWFDRLPRSIHGNKNNFDDPLTREIDLFGHVIMDRAPPHATIDDAIQNLAVAEAIRKSLISSAFEEVAPLFGPLARGSRVPGGRECVR